MNTDISGTAVLTAPEECENSTAEVCTASAQWADLEFQATLQLLVERARFLTGAGSVAIALQNEDRLTYSVGCGTGAPEPGKLVDLTNKQFAQCVNELKPFQAKAEGSTLFTLIVPILQDSNFAGFFQLVSEIQFEETDLQAVGRLTQLVATAIEFRDGANKAARQEFEDVPQPQLPPSLWHAPQTVQQQPSQPEPGTANSSSDVRKCASCGFPVSGRRALCLECEQKADVAQSIPEILTTPSHESWIIAHGYTIATLLVSAAAITILLWLRH